MTTVYYPQLLLDCICDDATRTSNGDETDVTDWDKTDKFIICCQIGYNGKDTTASAYKLQWRDVTDEGTFADVSDTGEIKWSATSDTLSDGTAVTDSTRRCTPEGGQSWTNGLESIGDNTVPDAGTLDLGNDEYTEIQWGLDPADAEYEHEYAFQMYNTTEGSGLGECASTITMAAAPVTRRVFITHQ